MWVKQSAKQHFFAATGVAHAGGLQDVVRGSMRPELNPEQAVLMLLDARGTLYELKALSVITYSLS